ncbi:MAG: lamin tail domain-containing protein, partial [Patescibacteria group bacterium]
PASAQETPPDQQDSTEQTETITSEQYQSEQTSNPTGDPGETIVEPEEQSTTNPDTGSSVETDTDVQSSSQDAIDSSVQTDSTDESVEADATDSEDTSIQTDTPDTTDETAEPEASFTSASLPRIIISEINWAGSELSQADEWLEITNADGQTVDLSGWILTGCATSGNAIALADGTMLANGDTLLISNYDLGSDKTTLTIQPDLVTASISLSNSAQQIMLAMPDGTVVDSVGDGTAPVAGSTSPKTSMVRDLSTLEWASATASANLSDPTQLGNPGTLVIQVADEQVVTDESESDEQDLPDQQDLEETDTDNPTDEPDTTMESDQLSTCSLIINEFVSNPNADELEWIEIYNPCDLGIDLTDWAVRDATAKETMFEEIELDSGSFLVVTKPLGQLNNDGDTIELLNANDQIVDSVIYGDDPQEPSKGWALARDNQGIWLTTCTPTPGSANELTDVCIVQDETAGSDEQDLSETETIDTTDTTDESDTTDVTDASDTTESDTTESDTQSTTQSDTSDTPTSYSPGSLILNEIVSDPAEGDTEWIELFNPTSANIDLSSWTITDESGKATLLDGLTINTDGYLVIESPKGKLNNDGDTVSLFDPAGNLISSMSYGTDDLDNPKKGESLAWNGSAWAITSNITKSTANQEPYEDQTSQSDAQSDTQSTTTTESGTSNSGSNSQTQQQTISNGQSTSLGNDSNVSNQPETHHIVAVAEAPKTNSSSTTSSVKKASTSATSQTTVNGTVTAVPGVFGSQLAFIEGMQLYFYYADWPTLEVGDIVSVKGEMSESRGEERIKISDMRDIQITGHVDLETENMTVANLFGQPDGTLVTIEGTVQDIQDTKLTLKDNTGSITVIANTHEGMNWNTVGSNLRITGILRTVSDEQRLYPRDMQDIETIAQEQATEQTQASIAVGQSTDYTPWIGGGLLAMALGGLAYFFVRRSHLETSPIGA